MDIHHLKVFALVFKYKSFSEAADELHLTQPTVSQHIRALEEELNCKLFDRLARKIIPTKEAGVLIGRAQEIIEKAESFKNLLGEFREDMTGHIIIGASSIPGTYILPGIISEFRRKRPSVLFEIVVSDSRGIIDKVSDHDLLIGIVGARLDSRQLQYIPFLNDELVVIDAPTLAKSRSMDFSEIIDLPMVMREQGSGTRREFEKVLIKHKMDENQLNIVGIFGSTDAVKQAVKQGVGISVVSRRAVRDELKCNVLSEIKIKDSEMQRQFFIVTHRKRTLPHNYKSFLEYLLSSGR